MTHATGLESPNGTNAADLNATLAHSAPNTKLQVLIPDQSNVRSRFRVSGPSMLSALMNNHGPD